MREINFTVRPDYFLRVWPRIERYQNSTLRYTPPKDFPAYWVKMNQCRPKIIRTWVTLDEIWDIDTDQYRWNYRIGADTKGEKRYYPYDWPSTVPSETLFEDYLTSYCNMAEEAMLNIRRFERETADGVLSLSKYEEVVRNVIEHCRELCPNITYIEVSNESEAQNFGGISIQEYMNLYDCVCRAAACLNKRRGWDLKVGGTAMTDCEGFLPGMWHEFMKALAENACPQRRIDFYSFHAYDPDTNRLQQMANLHRSAVKEYHLPDAPVFFDEYGVRGCGERPIDNLMNASGTLRGMLRAADLENFYVFPWCTYHNPGYQMSYTQYIRLKDGGYAPTANGMSMLMLSRMLRNEIAVEGDTGFRVRATSEGNRIVLILTNPDDDEAVFNADFKSLAGSRIKAEIRQVDEQKNNAVMNPPCNDLAVTEYLEADIADGIAHLSLCVPRYGFALMEITLEG